MKIAIVNDLSLAIEAIRRVVTADGRHQVVWVAHDGAEAVEKCAGKKPDLILMDLVMPVLNGVEATRRIMARTPCPILVVTGTMDGPSNKVFEALGAGAIDAMETPILGAKDSKGAAMLLEKLEELDGRINHLDRTSKLPRITSAAPVTHQGEHLVAIGASAGGPMALVEILSSLPADFPAAIIVVQHVDAQFTPGLAEWLGQHSHLPIRLAQKGDRPETGVVLMAATSDHLVFIGPHTLSYTNHPLSNVYRPSVDVFFQSVVKHWRGRATGVLLTGMGRDGAKGLKMMRDAGHHTIAQDRETCAVYGMPKAAVALGAAAEILPLNRIAGALQKVFVPHSLRKALL